MREKIFSIIRPNAEDSKLGRFYDILMIVAIIVSIIPLCFKQEVQLFSITEKITVVIFIIDYLMRWATADYLFDKKSIGSFIRYPFSLMAIIDLLSILPSLIVLNSGFKAFRLLRLMRALKVIRVFKSFRYSKNIMTIVKVIENQRDNLLTVFGFAAAYVFVSAIVIFQVEPETFNSFFDAVYWATISLTTVGYGDIFAVSSIGKIITMLSAVIGIAIVALPAGLITAGYMDELQREGEENKGE